MWVKENYREKLPDHNIKCNNNKNPSNFLFLFVSVSIQENIRNIQNWKCRRRNEKRWQKNQYSFYRRSWKSSQCYADFGIGSKRWLHEKIFILKLNIEFFFVFNRWLDGLWIDFESIGKISDGWRWTKKSLSKYQW